MKNPTSSKPKDGRLWRDSYYHRLLGFKAATRVELVLPIFENERPDDRRPRHAVVAIKAWAEGKRKLGMADVRKLSLSAHAAARDVESDAAKYVAHAAGQAVGTWHVPTHALGAFEYAGRVFVAIKKDQKTKRKGSQDNELSISRRIKAIRKSSGDFTNADLEEALRAITSMIRKIEKAQRHFVRGTSQHTLAGNRLKALRIASALITRPLKTSSS